MRCSKRLRRLDMIYENQTRRSILGSDCITLNVMLLYSIPLERPEDILKFMLEVHLNLKLCFNLDLIGVIDEN